MSDDIIYRVECCERTFTTRDGADDHEARHMAQQGRVDPLELLAEDVGREERRRQDEASEGEG